VPSATAYARRVTGHIHIRDLSLRTIIGVHEHERDRRQEVLLTLDIEADLDAAAASDDLDDAVNYGSLARQITGHVEESRYRLVERLAASVADLVLEQFPPVRAVTVTVDKPGALAFARSVAVTLRRERA